MVILGNTKAGKSTLLNEIMEGKIVLNTGAARETSFMWRISFSETYQQYDMFEYYSNEATPSSKQETEKFLDISESELK